MSSKKLYYNFPEEHSFIGVESITFNGLHYVFLDSHNCRVILLYKNFHPFKTISLHRNYSNICFDNIHKCYWAISNNSASVIYKLDCNFIEISKNPIKDVQPFNATGISYNHYDSSLWISFSNCIGCIKKGHSSIDYILNKRETMVNKAILSLPHCTLISYNEDCKQFIEICNTKTCEDLVECLPKGYTIEDMCLTSFVDNKDKHFNIYSICLLLSKNCSNIKFIMRCDIKFCENHPPEFICDDMESIQSDSGSCDCSEESCNSQCSNECSCFNKFNCNVKYEIMHSIALEEAAIAHILNAEGEKIQKAVACSNNIDKLLCVNESVKQTIIHITQLETQLYLKLSALQKDDCCNTCCENPCDIDYRCLLDLD